ncbi:MAG: glycosyltransferase [Alphaproteobacteria bacterium]|nr:glycosyltransferase [Alphaproteobacteria bacterium]
MRALFLKGMSTYGATRLFIDEIAGAYERRGGEAVVVDLSKAESELDYLSSNIVGQNFGFVFSIGLFAELRDGRGRTVAQVVGAPHVVQYVDYPLSHYARLARTPDSTAILVVDPTHVDAMRSVYGADRFAHVAFSPHGAIEAVEEPHARIPFEERPIDLLFPGSFYKPGPPLWQKLDGPTQKVFERAVELCLAVEFLPALTGLDQAISEFGGHLGEPLRTDLRLNAFAVHERVRQQRRFDMLKAAAKAGLRMHIAGEGYERDLYRFKSVNYLGARSLDEVLALMRQSKIVLNVNANFGCGSHERPLSSMLAGAVAMTDASDFYDAAFADNEIISLRWGHLQHDLLEAAKLAQRPDLLSAMAVRGEAKVRAGHLWDHRLDAVLAAADHVRG